jgi:hypothetical protein
VIVFIVVALTLLGFSIVRYQIIKDFASPLLLARSSEALPGSSLFAGEFSREHADPHNHPISPAPRGGKSLWLHALEGRHMTSLTSAAMDVKLPIRPVKVCFEVRTRFLRER